jgi:hypothetical protein
MELLARAAVETPMPEYSDIYVISKKRDSATVGRFLDEFVPAREEGADEYEVPQYAGTPTRCYDKAEPIIR